MSKLLSPAESVQLIEQLKIVVREFSSRADEVEREFRGRLEASERKLKTSVAEAEQRIAEESAKASSAYKAGKERLAENHRGRAALLARAHKGSTRRRLDFIEAVEGRQKYAVQKRDAGCTKAAGKTIGRVRRVFG